MDVASLVGALASVGAFVVALWLAVRTIRGEQPKLAIAALGYDKVWVWWDIGYFGVAVTVGVVNHSRVGNGIREIRLHVVSDGGSADLQPAMKVVTGPDGGQDLYMRADAYADAPAAWTLTELPEPVPALSVSKVRAFGTGHVVKAFGNQKAQDIFTRRREPDAPGEFRVRVRMQDVHGRWYEALM